MAALPAKKKKNNKSLFKRISAWLHLWLGLASGLIVVIVSLTGCMYVFEHEIKDLIEDWRFVEPQQKSFLLPTQLVSLADKHLKGKHASSVTLNGKDEAAIVGYFTPGKGGRAEGGRAEAGRSEGKKVADKRNATRKPFARSAAPGGDIKNKKQEVKGGRGRGGIFTSVYMNPYTGEILQVKSASRGESPDFFRFMLNGHRALWLPYNIGRPIVGVAVLVFVVLLLSGLVLWWPVKWIKSIRDKSFKIKWNASFKRVNYDMHNVFGFYSMIFLLFISLTGLVWSFQWFSKGAYWITSGGKSLVDTRRSPSSDTTLVKPFQMASVDKIWLKLKQESPSAAGIMISIPAKPADAIGAFVYKASNTFYNMDRYSYDQQSLKEITVKSPFSGKYITANLPDKIRRMNYDIHVGSVLGLPGKIIAFFASLISASLPITGFLIWWGKKKKSKKPAAKPVLKKTEPMPKKQVIIKQEEPVYS
jgi:uncharacterized iron-regulated membrane protein